MAREGARKREGENVRRRCEAGVAQTGVLLGTRAKRYGTGGIARQGKANTSWPPAFLLPVNTLQPFTRLIASLLVRSPVSFVPPLTGPGPLPRAHIAPAAPGDTQIGTRTDTHTQQGGRVDAPDLRGGAWGTQSARVYVCADGSAMRGQALGLGLGEGAVNPQTEDGRGHA
ncbi:hypothetical protein M427DRAFT_38286 [Gonapodya prolifera JEL478]|uniref:Uncharacterized protein n=1 Tax=Gonapodya prolifera (strain JEL478) TaxID=1344416 RepID=A0A139A0H2_GONPJ|nr:hypothetical protein M427DRAFT_38286 [Gonapodya prolifera JEL478]|eukprot:KXS09863.1 hypothetical protein M427DRAFT_38286 [Gonapodya prolifera JEL478]